MALILKLVILAIVLCLIFFGFWAWRIIFWKPPVPAPAVSQPVQTQVVIKDALDNDLSLIDAQLQSLAADSASADQAINQFLAQSKETTVGINAMSIATIISLADNKADQGIKDLNVILPAVNAPWVATIQNEINDLTELKAKIDQDTSRPQAIVDYQAIAKSYKAYLLILPQVRIIIASDRVMTIAGSMDIIGAKVKQRISLLTGINLAPIQQIFSDFSAKLNDAKAQAKAAAAGLSSLPDARAKIKTAISDLLASRKSIGIIITDLKEIGGQK